MCLCWSFFLRYTVLSKFIPLLIPFCFKFKGSLHPLQYQNITAAVSVYDILYSLFFFFFRCSLSELPSSPPPSSYTPPHLFQIDVRSTSARALYLMTFSLFHATASFDKCPLLLISFQTSSLLYLCPNDSCTTVLIIEPICFFFFWNFF